MEFTQENAYAVEKIIETISKCNLDMKNSCDVLRYVAKQIERTAVINVNALQEVVEVTKKFAED